MAQVATHDALIVILAIAHAVIVILLILDPYVIRVVQIFLVTVKVTLNRPYKLHMIIGFPMKLRL